MLKDDQKYSNLIRGNTRELEEKFARALIEIVRSSRGKRVTVRARQLVRIAGVKMEHGNIVRAAQFLKKLALRRLVTPEIRKRFARSVSLNYVLDENSSLWKIIKSNPEEAFKLIIEAQTS